MPITMDGKSRDLTRRDLLVQGLAFPFALQAMFASEARATILGVVPFLDDKLSPSTITEHGDKIIPFDLTRLMGWITPADQFYIRNHFAVPKVSNARDWSIRVGGNVRHAQQIGLDEFSEFPRVERVVTLECAGNSKRRNHGLVSNAKWTGVPLHAVLEKAGLQPNARNIVFHGADSGGRSARHFARALSIEQARRPEVMLATDMNDKPLPHDHGFPVRLIVPGWYGMAHVKWLERIEVIDTPFDGMYQTTHYVNKRAISSDSDAVWKPEPITKIPVKSIVATVLRDYHAVGNLYQVSGVVWGGHTPIQAVNITIDGSTHRHSATLQPHTHPFAWTRWSYQWGNQISGIHTLASRGIDRAGHRQPSERSSRLRGPYQHDEIILRRVKLS
ncbi:MAG TPA: hypothetical protein EYN18_01235 [Nitrospirales bacterium]|nr:hypothetical protein [Nitrospirales bacterium]HIO21008.1 hypothetical protein [Nitrospirales bacterium]